MSQTLQILNSAAPALFIERGIAIPPKNANWRRPGPLTVALRQLAKAEIGDSMFVPPSVLKNPKFIGARLTSAAGKGVLSSRPEQDGCRVWKIAEPATEAAA